MNKSIETVAINTTSEKVRALTCQLYANRGKRCRAVVITAKHPEGRVMDFVPRYQYNAQLGIKSTQPGKAMVATKARRDMVTVAEIVGDRLQPRTLNLRNVVGDITVIAC
jgi:hypothetical protein